MADEPKTKPDDSVPEQVHPVDPGIAAARAVQGRGRRPSGRHRGPGEAAEGSRGYWRRLRETEAERDKVQARAEQADRLEVERAVTGDGGLQNADDFWLAVQLDDLRDADGALDAAKFKAARDRVIADRPALAQARSELRRWRSGDASGYVRAELWAGTEADGDGRLHQPFSLACPDLRCRLR